MSKDDDDDDAPFTHRIVKMKGSRPDGKPPTNVATSVFDLARAGTSSTPKVEVPLAAIVIRKDVPKPTLRHFDVTYRSVVEQMVPGDSVELPKKQALRFLAAAKAAANRAAATTDGPKPRFSIRMISPTHAGIWRDS